MALNRRFVSWTLAVASALAFVVGASAQQLARAVSQAVVTPDDPIFARPGSASRRRNSSRTRSQRPAGRGGRGGQPARAAAVRAGHHRSGEDRRRHLQGASHRRARCSTRFPKARARQGLPLEHADQEDDDRRRLRRPGGRQPRRALGAEGRPRPAPEHRLQHRRRPVEPDRAGRRRREQPGDHPRVQRRGLQRRPAIRSST